MASLECEVEDGRNGLQMAWEAIEKHKGEQELRGRRIELDPKLK